METEIEEIAAVLRSTDKMAAGFAERVQERVGQPVSYTEILATMQKISPTTFTMDKLVIKLRRQLHLH